MWIRHLLFRVEILSLVQPARVAQNQIMDKQLIDLTGRVVGRLKVLGLGARDSRGDNRWLCRCTCGKEMLAWGHRLRTGGDLSCGCWGREKTSARVGRHYMHGTPEYRAWQAMKNRCRNPNVANYPRYGGRGISVCDAWSEGFEAFLADVGPRPSDSHSLGRIDNDGNYEPSNVRWELPNEQANNKSDSRFVEYRGERMTVKQAIRAAGSIVAQDTVNYRLKQGWSVERAVESRPRYWVQPDEGSV